MRPPWTVECRSRASLNSRSSCAGAKCRRCPRLDTQLLEDMPNVDLHGHGADEELAADRGVGQSLREQGEHFLLSTGECHHRGRVVSWVVVTDPVPHLRLSTGSPRARRGLGGLRGDRQSIRESRDTPIQSIRSFLCGSIDQAPPARASSHLTIPSSDCEHSKGAVRRDRALNANRPFKRSVRAVREPVSAGRSQLRQAHAQAVSSACRDRVAPTGSTRPRSDGEIECRLSDVKPHTDRGCNLIRRPVTSLERPSSASSRNSSACV